MRYNVEDIEDQIIATLEADTTLSGVTKRTHAGEVNIRTFTDAAMMEGFVNSLPFIFIQYQGKKNTMSDSTKGVNVHELTFRLFIGAESLREKKEAQRGAYSILRKVYDDLHGKVPLSSPQMLSGVGAQNGYLSGTVISTSGFNPQTPLQEQTGADEKLIVNLPNIVVYASDYRITLVA